MTNNRRVVTANLPIDLVEWMDEVAKHIDRSKSWIIREAVADWLVEQQRRYELTHEALKDVDEGRTFTQDRIARLVQQRKLERREAAAQ